MSTNSKQISPAELAPGMFVTVLENKPHIREDIVGGLLDAKILTATTQDRCGYGDVLTVLVVELPYVVVRYENKYETSRLVVQKDTRRTSFMELSDEYVLALHPYLLGEVKKNKEEDQVS